MREEKEKYDYLLSQADMYYKIYTSYNSAKTEYSQKSDENILENMDINVIEQFLRKKKLEKLNQK